MATDYCNLLARGTRAIRCGLLYRALCEEKGMPDNWNR